MSLYKGKSSSHSRKQTLTKQHCPVSKKCTLDNTRHINYFSTNCCGVTSTLHSPESVTRPPGMLCWLNNLHMLSLSNLYHNDKLNNQAWMRDWHSLSWLMLDCSVNNTGLVDWLILVCWSSREEVTIVVFPARRAPWMLTQQSYSCAPSNVDWIYQWMATFSTFDAMSRWLHFWESVHLHVVCVWVRCFV